MGRMTEGSVVKHLIAYAVPMILGNILQLTYNAADSVVIGKCLGESALAAVSTANPIMTILILGASGLGIGASVLISRFYGGGDGAKLKRAFSTTVIFGAAFSLAVFTIGFALSEPILRWINTPAEALAQAKTYLRIIFVGFLFTFQYNILASAMRGIGDSKTPVFFLGVSCGLNILLDVLFVYGLGMGVTGAGLATVIAEGVSAVCCAGYIGRRVPALRLSRREMILDKPLLAEILKIGSLTALQQAAQPIGKVLIQSVVNAQGVTAIGAFNAVCRLDDFACIPAQSIGSGIMTCTAQNRGAGLDCRVDETFRMGMLTACLYYPIICGLTLLLKTPAMRLLTPDGSAAMVEMGVNYLNVKAWLFIMPCVTNAIQGHFRGMSQMAVVLMATLIQITLRTLVVYLWVPRLGIVGEAYACLIGWGVMAAMEFGYYYLTKGRRVKAA